MSTNISCHVAVNNVHIYVVEHLEKNYIIAHNTLVLLFCSRKTCFFIWGRMKIYYENSLHLLYIPHEAIYRIHAHEMKTYFRKQNQVKKFEFCFLQKNILLYCSSLFCRLLHTFLFFSFLHIYFQEKKIVLVESFPILNFILHVHPHGDKKVVNMERGYLFSDPRRRGIAAGRKKGIHTSQQHACGRPYYSVMVMLDLLKTR